MSYISERLPQYESSDQESPSKALLTFIHKLLNKMLTEIKAD